MGGKILVVEDEEAVASMIAMNLKAVGHEPTVFGDGEEAERALIKRHDYDLALLDVMLPGKDGFALMESVRPYGIPVIFLTAKSDLGSKLTGLTGGAEDYIVKPFEVLELLARIDKVLSRAQPRGEVLRALDLEIDISGRRVRKNGAEVALKPMEFDLLVALIKHKNVAVSREDLLGLVWGANYLGETRTVDVHIGQLRKKLNLYDAIKTVPKRGYRLEDI